MDAFELNKVVGAILMSVLIMLVVGHAADILLPHPELEKPAIAVPELAGAPAASATQEAAKPALQPIGPFLAKASVDQGKDTAKKCLACHSLAKGDKPKIGPNLYGIIGAKRAHEEGFAYSDALKSLGGTWNFDELNAFLLKPQTYLPGTKMSFPGLEDEQDRANVIAYLNSLSDAPQPLPKP